MLLLLNIELSIQLCEPRYHVLWWDIKEIFLHLLIPVTIVLNSIW
jgi:hypothetical protein